jgi:hypothetical protein
LPFGSPAVLPVRSSSAARQPMPTRWWTQGLRLCEGLGAPSGASDCRSLVRRRPVLVAGVAGEPAVSVSWRIGAEATASRCVSEPVRWFAACRAALILIEQTVMSPVSRVGCRGSARRLGLSGSGRPCQGSRR